LPDASSPGPVTYTFDLVAVTTLKITTSAGEDAARAAAAAIIAISTTATTDELDVDADIAPGTRLDVTTVAPRGRPCLVYAETAAGGNVTISESEEFLEPITDVTAEWVAGAAKTLADLEAARTNYTEEPADAALDAVTLDRADTLDPSLHAEALFLRAFLGEASRPPAGEAVADTSGSPGSQSVTFRYLSPIGRWELTLRASPEDPAPPIPEWAAKIAREWGQTFTEGEKP
jgi:hypothetical protein